MFCSKKKSLGKYWVLQLTQSEWFLIFNLFSFEGIIYIKKTTQSLSVQFDELWQLCNICVTSTQNKIWNVSIMPGGSPVPFFIHSPCTPHNHPLTSARFVLPIFETNIHEITQHVFCVCFFSQHKVFWYTSVWLYVSIICSSFFSFKSIVPGMNTQIFKMKRIVRNNFGLWC